MKFHLQDLSRPVDDNAYQTCLKEHYLTGYSGGLHNPTSWLNNVLYLDKSLLITQLKENTQGQQSLPGGVLKPSHLCEHEMGSVLIQGICHLAGILIFSKQCAHNI
jgi:hypothetical protein